VGIIKKQGLSNTTLIYVGTAIGFVSLVLIQPRFLSKEELGLIRLILAFSSVLSILFSVGISAVTIRYFPRVFDPQSRHRGFFGFLLAYTAAGIMVGSLILYFAKDLIFRFYASGSALFNDRFGYVFLLTTILSFVLGFNAYCIALMRTIITTVLNDIVVRLLLIAIIFVRFSGLFNLEQFLLAFCGIYAFQAIVLLFAIFQHDRPGLMPHLGFIRETIGIRSILRYGIVITLTALNSVTLKYVDTMFVGRISLDLVAIYSVAAFIGLAVEIPLNALERIANPSISFALARKDMATVLTIYRDSAKALLLLGGLLFLLVALNARDLFALLPHDFSSGIIITQIVAFGALINMGTGVNYPILTNSHKYIWGSVFLVGLLVITVLGNILLIPKFGLLGPALAGCFASIVYNALKFEFIRRVFKIHPFNLSTLKALTVILVVFVLGWLVPVPGGPILSIALRTVLLISVYLGLTILWRTSDDLYRHIPASWRNRFPFQLLR
jgi:O-antigen/teichoic acid export membrane protein